MRYNNPILRNVQRLFTNKVFLILLLLLPILSFTAINLTQNKFYQKEKADKLVEQEQTQPQSDSSLEVLGHRTPQIYVSGGRQGYSGGGMIALASTDEPAINVGGYDISGSVEVSIYEATEQALLDYLTHDKEGKQTKKNPDINKFRYITKVDQQITSSGGGSKLLLPIGESGIYFLRIKQGSISEDSFVIRSAIGTIVKEGDNEYIFWGQNFKSQRSITEGSLSLYNLQDNLKEVGMSC